MQINEILASMGGLQSIGRELGISEAQVAMGAEALMPAILGGFQKQTQAQSGGFGALGALLGQLGGGSLLDNVLSPQPTDVSQGNSVLGAIFGSKDVSRTVASNAAATSGLSPELLRKMLPMLAMLVTGYMARQSASGATESAPPAGGLGGGLGGLLGGLLGGQAAAGAPARGGGLASLASLLDANGDGNPLDDILRMAQKFRR